MGKTSFQTPSRKTQGGPSSGSSPKKVPRISELADAKDGNARTKNPKDKSIHLYELAWNEDGSVYGGDFEGEMGALHLEHAYPNVFFLMIRTLKEYVAFKRTTDISFPETWLALCEALKIKLATTSAPQGQREVTDTDHLNTFVKDRVAIYHNRKDLKNVICFLDELVAWRITHELGAADPKFDKTYKIIVHIQEDTDLTFEKEDNMMCEIEVEKDMDTTGITVWQAHPPCWPPRFVVATVTSESENTISVVFSGTLLPFAENFQKKDIGLKVLDATDGGGPEYFRCLRGINISDEEKREFLLSIFGDGVLKGSPCLVRVESFPKKDKDWNTLRDEISQLSNVRMRT